jgi:hypothetical protein
MHNIDFNFTPEQNEKFNLIYKETGILHPHLLKDDVLKEKVKVMIAYSVITNDAPLEQQGIETEVDKNMFNEIIE